MGHMNTPRPDEKWGTPLPAEGRDIGGERYDGGRDVVHRAQEERGDFVDA